MKRSIQGQYAGAVTRGLAFLLDSLIIAVTLAVTTWLISTTLRLIGINIQDCPSPEQMAVFARVCNATRIVMAIYAALFAPLYAWFFWTFGGATPGMGVMGIRIVRVDGKPLTFFNSVRRVLGFALCLVTLGIGFAKMLIDNQRQGLHDSIAGTCVIYAWRGEQNVKTIARVEKWMNRRKNNSQNRI